MNAVGDTLRLGANGPALRKVDSSTIEILNPALTGYTVLKTKAPVGADDLATKKWLEDEYALGNLSTFNTYVSNTSGADTYNLPEITSSNLEDTYVFIKLSAYQNLNVLRIVPFSGQKISFNNEVIENPGYVEIKSPNYPIYLTATAIGTWTVTSISQAIRNDYSIVSRNTWVSKATAPTSRQLPGGYNLNGYGYTVGGTGGGTGNENHQYNDTSDTWATKAVLPANRYGTPGIVLNGFAYYYNGSGPTNLNTQYGDVTNLWVAKTVESNSRLYIAAFSYNGFAYSTGGYNGGGGTAMNFHTRYSDSLNSWTSMTVLPTSRRASGYFVLNDIGYNITGSITATPQTTTFAYIDASNAWIQKTDIPVGFTLPGCFTVNGSGHVIGDDPAVNYAYNDVTNSWVSKTALSPRVDAPASYNLSGYGYISCGIASGVSVTNTTLQYN